MFDILDAILTIVDAISFGKKVDREKPHNKKWRLIGAALLLVVGIAGLVIALILVGMD